MFVCFRNPPCWVHYADYITESPEKSFQPMKANFGLLPELIDRFVPRLERAARYVAAASQSMDNYLLTQRELLGLK